MGEFTGHCSLFVFKKFFHYNLCIFSARVVSIWNSLPNSVVDANTVNAFKAGLDKF